VLRMSAKHPGSGVFDGRNHVPMNAILNCIAPRGG
jgi:hypothetical protein